MIIVFLLDVQSPVYRCEICGLTTSSKTAIQDDIARHIRRNTKYKICQNCQQFFTYDKHFVVHKNVCKKRKFQCNFCPLSFNSRKCIFHHLISKHISQPKIYKCFSCSYTTKHKQLLQYHSKSHSKLFACKKCDKRYAVPQNLKFHLKTHEGIKDFECKVCLKVYSRRDCLKDHIRKTHLTDIKLFNCEICSYVGKTRNALWNHNRIHTLQFSCTDCEKKFGRKSSLARHMKKHILSQDTCKRSAARRIKVQKSVRKSAVGFITFYLCDKCGFKFSSKINLKIHFRSQMKMKNIVMNQKLLPLVILKKITT